VSVSQRMRTGKHVHRLVHLLEEGSGIGVVFFFYTIQFIVNIRRVRCASFSMKCARRELGKRLRIQPRFVFRRTSLMFQVLHRRFVNSPVRYASESAFTFNPFTRMRSTQLRFEMPTTVMFPKQQHPRPNHCWTFILRTQPALMEMSPTRLVV
jgi:hypothetical protein